MKSLILGLSIILLSSSTKLGLHLKSDHKDEFFASHSMYPFELPPLPYPYDYVDAWVGPETMSAHHDNHHQTYVDKLNEGCEEDKSLQGKTLVELVTDPETKDINVVKKHGGGHYYHSLFWWILTEAHADHFPKKDGSLGKAIDEKFGSFGKFQEEFEDAAKGVFGSGWALLAICPDGPKIMAKSNQNIPDCPFILGLDVWEHAYYLDYKWQRADYVSGFWQMIDWKLVEHLYDEYASVGAYVPF